MAAPFKNRFKNFFLNPRISRDNMRQLAAHHLNALEAPQQPAGAPDTASLAAKLRPLYEQFGTGLGTGAAALAQRQGETTSVGAAFEALKSYPAEAARKFILPQFEEKSAEYQEFFPQGRSAFSGASQKSIGTYVRAFIVAAQKYAPQIGDAVATRAQELLVAFEGAAQVQGQADKATQDGRQAIQADQRALAVQLFTSYATLLAAFAATPAQAATYFDFSVLPSTKKTKAES